MEDNNQENTNANTNDEFNFENYDQEGEQAHFTQTINNLLNMKYKIYYRRHSSSRNQ